MGAVFSVTDDGYSTSSPVVTVNGEMRLMSAFDLNPKSTTSSAALQSVFDETNAALRVR